MDPADVYSVVLSAISGRESPLLASMGKAQEARGRRLFLLHTQMPGVLPGLDEGLEYLQHLASFPGLDSACSGLIMRAREDLLIAIEALLSDHRSVVMDAARDLMEIEYLLYEFAAQPDRIEEWKSLSERRRAQLFGFGELQKREDKRRGIPIEKTGPERLEYQAHCAGLHPSPSGRLLPPYDDERLLILSELQELTEHTRRVFVAAAGLYPDGALAASGLPPWQELAGFGAVWEAGVGFTESVKAEVPGGWPVPREPYERQNPPVG